MIGVVHSAAWFSVSLGTGRCLATTFNVVLLSKQVTERSELVENCDGKLHALGLDLPKRLVSEFPDFFADLHHRVRVVTSNGAEYVERINANGGALVAEANKRIIEEHVEPLLVELCLLTQKVSLCCIDEFILNKMLLE